MMKRYTPLYEYVHIDRLKKNRGMSSRTGVFRRERDSLMGGNESKYAKFIEVEGNPKDDYVDCYFLTPVTQKYKPDHKFKEVIPTSKALIDDPSRTYTIIVRILFFFSILDSMLEKKGKTYEELNNDDIEQVLKTAYVQVWNSSPSFHWQGINYNISRLDGSVYPTSIKPRRWDRVHGATAKLDKHLQGVINNFDFYVPQIRMSIKKLLGKTKPKPEPTKPVAKPAEKPTGKPVVKPGTRPTKPGTPPPKK